MYQLFAISRRVASTKLAVVIEGEPGTGRLALAQAIHAASDRRDAPVMLLERAWREDGLDLVRCGAALGDVAREEGGVGGLLERANGGTVIIVEPAELPSDLQRKLARVLGRRELVSADGEAKPVDLRLVTISRADIDTAVQDGRLCEELYFAIADVRLEIPPLRSRPSDIELIAKDLWAKLGGPPELDETFLDSLLTYPWPGNVRELEGTVLRRLVLGEVQSGARVRSSAPPRPDSLVVDPHIPGTPRLPHPLSEPAVRIDAVLGENLPLKQARQNL